MSTHKGKILLVDDEQDFARVFASELECIGYQVTQGFGKDVLAILKKEEFDIVILDILMPGITGLDLLRQIRAQLPELDVIMLSGNATVENAITSMKEGAYDYFTKPAELERVEQVLNRCMNQRRLKHQNLMMKEKLSDLQDNPLIGESPAMQEVNSLISRFADSDSTVLIHGESGTGKELVAHQLHRYSPRRDEPFMIVDCTALKENLLESELFGHERGAFTDAVTKKHGIFEIASGGTVFLDEIGDIPPSLQVKLLRVVETKSFRRLGGTERIHVDVRLIAATNRDLEEMVKADQFREDLYYRINVINITLPPLRQHTEDIPRLVEHFLGQSSMAGERVRFSKEAMDVLKHHSWPGNVRELRNVVERCLLLAESDTINASDVPLSSDSTESILSSLCREGYPTLQELEDAYIRRVLEKTGGNKQLAAKILKIDRKTILRRLGSDSTEE